MLWVIGIIMYLWVARYLIPTTHNFLFLAVMILILIYSIRLGAKIFLILLTLTIFSGFGLMLF